MLDNSAVPAAKRPARARVLAPLLLLLAQAVTLAARQPPLPPPSPALAKPKPAATALYVPKPGTPPPPPSPAPSPGPATAAPNLGEKSAVEEDDGDQTAADTPPPPQYTMGFGKCGPRLQRRQYGNWKMTYNISEQRPGKLLLWLDTQNRTAVASCFGAVEPADFPITAIYFAYFNYTEGVAAWSPALDLTPYKEMPTAYWIKVNGRSLFTVRDLKDFGTNTATSSTYSLKGTHNGLVKPSPDRYKVEIVKYCDGDDDCARIPEPSTVFISPQGHVVFSLWSVGQPLRVNGVLALNHAWCPVQSAVTVR
ncbi:hypothetical protein HYH02_005170 [Chlamydomonas schloesseri]|uniref:Uncharacterized protein n=1 Tax=Chlamydomonas schloesseri TaxID=2026947 RepID=A0A835WL78_9CHLO|nr:hypothetical protein HYH02_005170 [Chlamydomonas schloesseri]|eukprot:KAG2449637.1 hypothetical protein HYH02_005170 [Chlamydomonas schloesseri]